MFLLKLLDEFALGAVAVSLLVLATLCLKLH